MKTIKIIDLLVDLNNFNGGELVNMPEKIKYNNKIFYFNSDDVKGYYTEKPGHGGESLLKEIMDLNHIVEILEEEKKIPEKLDLYEETQNIIRENNYKLVYHDIHKCIVSLECKYNQLIDYLKSKGE